MKLELYCVENKNPYKPQFYLSVSQFKMYNSDNYGYDGPIVVDNHRNAIIDTWFEVGRELGYQILDPNGFQQEGLFRVYGVFTEGVKINVILKVSRHLMKQYMMVNARVLMRNT